MRDKSWVQTMVAIVACVAILLVGFQLYQSNKAAGKAEAYEAYRAYLSMAIEKPEFAGGVVTIGDVTNEYEWFVGYLLNSVGQVAASSGYDAQWKQVLVFQLCLHRFYLESSLFSPELAHYSTELQALLGQAKKDCGMSS